MKKPILFLLLSLALCSFNRPPHEPSTIINWSKEYKLAWSDFKGAPDPDSHGDAATAIRIEAKPYYKGRKLLYDVNALFIPEKSWYRHQSDELLAHEQLHFDLAELYARKARMKIAELQQAKVRDVKQYNQAVQEILNESNDADQAYDRETLHGSLPKAQSRWKFKVELELLLLEEYAVTSR